MKSPILGSSYVARSINAAANRMVNLFPEIVPEGGKEAAFLNRAPGLTLLATVGSGPIRGMWVLGPFLYVVSGTHLYKVTSAYVITDLGAVDVNSNTQVSMSDNGTQIFIAGIAQSYIYNTAGASLTLISDTSFPGAGIVGFIDGYFVFNKPNSNQVWVSKLLDGLTYNALAFAGPATSATSVNLSSSNNIVGIVVDHRVVWIFTGTTVEIWYDAGTIPFPLAPLSGALSETGCAAAFSIAKMDNAIFWLGRDARGQGIIYRSNGFTGERISTHAVEWQVQQYGDLSNAVAYTYQQDGHSFYVLTFPSAGATWVYDVSTQAWHERAALLNGNLTRHAGNCQAFFNNLNIVGDWNSGNLYALDLNAYSDNGNPQRWLRSWRAMPPDQNNLKRTAQHSLQLDCETGVGLVSGQGSDPQVMLRWSDDGGHTWSNEHWVGIGKIGTFGQRAIWRRLGMTQKIRDRVYEVSGTDPVKIAIVGAELVMDETSG